MKQKLRAKQAQPERRQQAEAGGGEGAKVKEEDESITREKTIGSGVCPPLLTRSPHCPPHAGQRQAHGRAQGRGPRQPNQPALGLKGLSLTPQLLLAPVWCCVRAHPPHPRPILPRAPPSPPPTPFPFSEPAPVPHLKQQTR
jgi:hypothetical protein